MPIAQVLRIATMLFVAGMLSGAGSKLSSKLIDKISLKLARRAMRKASGSDERALRRVS